MKKQSYGKQIFSLFLALTLVFGMVGAISLPAKADEAVAEAKVLADELVGYNRITAQYFETLNNQRRGETFTLENAGKTKYVGNYSGKNYLDVDANFGEANSAHYLRYFGDAATTSIYKGAFAVRLYADKYNVNYIDFAYQDVDTKLNTVVPTKTLLASDYGITDPSADFNIKILTNIYECAEDASKDVIEYQFWLNDIFVCEGSFTETAHSRMGLCAQVAVGKSITVKTPAEPVDAFEGYTRVTIEDYDCKLDGNNTTTMAHGVGVTNQSATGMDKSYIDVDVNYNGNVDYSKFMLRFFASDKYKNSYNLSWETANQLIITRYDNAQGFTILDRVKNLADYGISGPSDWFNVKFLVDFTPNETDATKQTAKLQLWLNDKLAWEKTVEEVNASASRNKIFANSNGGSISVRVPEKNVEDELKGYTPITLDEYDCTMNIRGEISLANGGSVNSPVSNFDKTYLDVDVNFNGVVGKGSVNMRYQASAKWTDSYALGWNADGTSLHFFRYNASSKNVDFTNNIVAADYGITSTKDWINVKIRTDITVDEADDKHQTVHLQLWLNNKLAWECDVEETRASASRAAIFCTTIGTNTVMLRSPRVLENEMAGYERVTIEDVNNLGASRAEAGTVYASGKSGEYVDASFDKTYLDMDVQTTAGLFLTYLMSENTFWGNDRYQFELSGTNLKITQVEAGEAVKNTTLGLASAGYTEGSMFNLKIRTDIEPAGNGQNVIMQFWADDHYLAKLTFTESAVRTAKYMGIRGTGTGKTIVRTPVVNDAREAVAYDLSKGSYLLTGADYFYVNGKKMPSGTILNTPNDYVIEQIIDGVAVAKQIVSLYRIGDVNMDGEAFVAGDSVYKDSHALLGIVNYGTPVKAAELAADINNDGKVTQADYDEIVNIRSDVTLAEEIISKYHVASVYYEYLGGKDVMPIGGFYGPYSDATLTDAMYKLIAESGINLITYSGIDAASDANRLQQGLALAEKYGIGAFVTDSSLNKVTKNENDEVTAHTVVTNAQELAALMKAYSSYDSFLGITIVDEPKGSANWENDTHNNPALATDFSANNSKRYQYYEELAEALLPYANITGYINLHGSQSVDGGEFYQYASQIGEDLDVLSFDTYLYFEDNTYPLLKLRRLSSYLESLDTIRQVSLEQDKPFWSYVQAGSDYRSNAEGNDTATEGYYTEADTLWIINTSLAYGAKGIQYFPLLQPEYFSYDSTSESGHDYDRNGVIGANNEANRNYAMVQKANKQIQAIDDVLMNATSAGVIATGAAVTDMATASVNRGYEFTGVMEKKNNTYTAMLGDVTANSGAMVGVFDYQGYEAYYVVNYDRTEGASQNITLSLNSNAKYRVVADAVTTSGEGSSIALTIPSGAGVLVVLETLHEHSYGDWVITVPATVAAPGEKAQYCVCGHAVTEEIPSLVNVDSWNVTLGDDLAVNFVVDIHEDIADTAKIVVAVAGKEYTYDATEEVSVNVAAAQMNDEIVVQVADGGEVSTVKTYTVLQYAQYVLAEQSMSEYHQLVKEMLNYGGAAQTYFEYNDEAPVNAGLEGVGAEEVPADAVADMDVSGDVSGISFYGASLLFRNKIAIRYYFSVNGNIADYTFTVNGDAYTPVLSNGKYYIEVADINPQDLDDAVTVSVNDTLTVSYSPMNYIVRMSQKGSENLQALMKAIYNYHLAAEVLCPDAE